MKEIPRTESGLSTMCRLCLSSDVALSDIFCFSSKMEHTVAGVIMKYAAVQITRGDDMPNFICQLCYTQLEKTHQFLMQIEQSDKTLRVYLQQFYASDKPIKTESSEQLSKDPLIVKTNNDVVKCESFELNDVFNVDRKWRQAGPGNFIQDNKKKEELSLKCEIKVEPIDSNLFLTTECETGPENISSNVHVKEFSCEDVKTEIEEFKESEFMTVNWKEKEQENHLLTNMEKVVPKFDMKIEQMDDNLFIQTASLDHTVSASSNDDGMEISCNDTQINISHTSKNSRSVNVTENSNYCDETHKNISVNRKKLKKASPPDLYCHKRTHTDEKPYHCDLCNECFTQSGEFETHQQVHTCGKLYKCDLCDKSFIRLSHLRTHKSEHTGEKSYECDLCSLRFARAAGLYRHTLIHTGKKPYQCDLCKKCFTSSSNLIDHKRIHTGEKPYQCAFCVKCFALSSNLNTHMRIHTGEKPYKCNFCNKCFSQSSHLNKHKRTHTGEKPYQCDLCNKCFCQSSHLNKHKRTHSDEKK